MGKQRRSGAGTEGDGVTLGLHFLMRWTRPQCFVPKFNVTYILYMYDIYT